MDKQEDKGDWLKNLGIDIINIHTKIEALDRSLMDAEFQTMSIAEKDMLMELRAAMARYAFVLRNRIYYYERKLSEKD